MYFSYTFQSSKLAIAFPLPLAPPKTLHWLHIELLQRAWTMIYVRPHLHLCHKVAINHTRRQKLQFAQIWQQLHFELGSTRKAKQQQQQQQ